jgi:NADPH-dependent F420 reductase
MADHKIKIGSRNLEKAQRIVDELNSRIDNVLKALLLLFPGKMDNVEKLEYSTFEELERARKNITGTQNEDAVKDVDVIFLTVPFKYAKETLANLLPYLEEGTILVDVTVPLKKEGKTFVCDIFPEGSGSKHLAVGVPNRIPFVSGFKTISAHRLLHIERPLEGVDVFVASDDEDALMQIIALANSIRNLRGIDFGALLSSGSLEMMTAVLININIRHKVKQASFRVTI